MSKQAVGAVLALGLWLFAAGPAPRAAAPPVPVAWKKLFDGKSLAGWKRSGFYGEGKVAVQKGVVVLQKGKVMTGITYTRGDFPTMDYEVTLQGKKVAGRDFFCTTTFPVGKSHCSLVVGGWGGTTVGLSCVDAADASMNETNRSRQFKPGVWYRVRIRVSKHRIEAWIDRDRVVDLDTTDRQLDVRLECLASRPFGIATWKTSAEVRDVRVRPLTEAEKQGLARRKAEAKE
jgi:hypothetical protein